MPLRLGLLLYDNAVAPVCGFGALPIPYDRDSRLHRILCCNQVLCLKNKETGQLNVNYLLTVLDHSVEVLQICSKSKSIQYGVVPYDISNFNDLYLLQAVMYEHILLRVEGIFCC